MPYEEESPFDELLEEFEDRVGRLLSSSETSELDRSEVSLETREIFVVGDIDDNFGSWFTKMFRLLQMKSDEPITIWLNTPGGDEEGMLVFFDLVTTSKAPVTIVGSGSICSAGVLMLACGHHRLVTENCTLMSHESRGLGGPDLRHSEAKDRRKWEDWLHERWFELMARCTEPHNVACDVKFWKRMTEKKAEYWLLGGQDIINHGIADELYTPDKLPEPAKRGQN